MVKFFQFKILVRRRSMSLNGVMLEVLKQHLVFSVHHIL